MGSDGFFGVEWGKKTGVRSVCRLAIGHYGKVVGEIDKEIYAVDVRVSITKN